MIKIAICDDSNDIINQIENYVNKIFNKDNILVDVDTFYSGKELEREVYEGTKYDLLFLDIQMGNGDGITAAKNIRKIDENVLIVYVSGYDKYMQELFRLDVFAFIKKPIEKELFKTILLDAYSKICSKQFYFNYRYKGIETKLPCRDIIYFESAGRQIYLHLSNGDTKKFNGKLDDVEKTLLNGKIPFLRTHQSYLINYHFIKSRSKAMIILSNEKELPISEYRQKRFNKEYVRLLGDEINV